MVLRYDYGRGEEVNEQMSPNKPYRGPQDHTLPKSEDLTWNKNGPLACFPRPTIVLKKIII